MLLLSPQPEGEQPGNLSQHDQALQIIVETAQQAEIEAMNDTGPYCTRSHRGVRRHQQGVRHAASRLAAEIGYEFDEPFGQPQLTSPPGLYGVRNRLIFSRGRQMEGYFRVPRKGNQTRLLIEENVHEVLQMALPLDVGPDSGERMMSWVVISDVDRDFLTVYLVLPISLDETGRRMAYSRCRVLFTGALSVTFGDLKEASGMGGATRLPDTLIEPKPVERPESVETDFLVEEI